MFKIFLLFVFLMLSCVSPASSAEFYIIPVPKGPCEPCDPCDPCPEPPPCYGSDIPAPLPKTGQYEAYEREYGDDGALQKGVDWPEPRFTDNQDGTVTDHLTGLVWLKNLEYVDRLDWWDALAFCAKLRSGLCGLRDGSKSGEWRLPNIRELTSLIDFGRLFPALSKGHPFQGVQSSYFWASTSLAEYGQFAWSMYLGSGVLYTDEKENAYYAWPVRDAR